MFGGGVWGAEGDFSLSLARSLALALFFSLSLSLCVCVCVCVCVRMCVFVCVCTRAGVSGVCLFHYTQCKSVRAQKEKYIGNLFCVLF